MKFLLKKTSLTIVLITSIGTSTLLVHQCQTLATTQVGTAIVRQILLTGLDTGMTVLKYKNAFTKKYLIEAALPDELKYINAKLEKYNPELVQKEKELLAETAAEGAKIAHPILRNAIQNMQAQDLEMIMNGKPGAGTEWLKQRTKTQLIAALTPQLQNKLNQNPAMHSLNSSLQGMSRLSSFFGNDQPKINKNMLGELASQLVVAGFYSYLKNYEIEERTKRKL